MPQPGGNANPYLPYPSAGGNPPYPTSNFGGFPGYPAASGGNDQPSSGYPPYMPNASGPGYNNFYGGVSEINSIYEYQSF